MQAIIIASKLRALGLLEPEAVSLEVWLSLGFLQRPSPKLLKKLATLLDEELLTQ